MKTAIFVKEFEENAISMGLSGNGNLRDAIDACEEAYPQWIDAKVQQPAPYTAVLAIVSGKPRANITLCEAYQLCTYYPDGEWEVEEYPLAKGLVVKWWMPLPPHPRDHDRG